jgi:hypothetical protein
MQRNLLFFMFLLLSITLKAHAQHTFAPIGAEWWFSGDSYDYSYPLYGYWYHDLWTDHAKVTNDTMINGINCNKITVTRLQSQFPRPDSVFVSMQTNYYVYDNTDTVFIYYPPSASFRPLYIFNVQENDTVCMQNPYPRGNFEDSLFCYVVDSVRSPMINNIPLKTIYTHPIYLGSDNTLYINWGSSTHNGAYSQRIGINKNTAQGFLPVFVFVLADGATFATFPFGKLRCYSDSTLSIHNGNLPCDTVLPLSVKNIGQMANKISIFPNPANNQINIVIKSVLQHDLMLTLTDITGHHLQQIKIPKRTAAGQIDVSQYPAGLYLITIECEGQRYYQKVAIQH